MKKTKDVSNTLYDFNAEDEDNIKKKGRRAKDKKAEKNKKDKKIDNKKDNKKTEKKEKKDKKSKAAGKKKSKKDEAIKEESINRFDFNNEIVIGLTRIDDELENNKKNKNKIKKSNKKSNQKEINSKNINIKEKDRNKEKNKDKNKDKDIKNKKNNKNNKNNKRSKGLFKKDKNNKNNQSEIIDNVSEQDLIFERKDNTKKKPKKGFRVFKYVLLLILIIGAAIAAMMSPLFNIKEIEVEGNEKISSDQIISLSQINKEENTYRINTRKAKKGILENPYIQDVKIKRQLPGKIIIMVEERKATFIIECGGGFAYINNQGYILEISDKKLDVPILQGADTIIENLEPGNRLDNTDLLKMSTVLKIMEIAYNNEISHLITRIDIENSLNYKIVFESEQKVAYLGDETDLNTKLLSIKSIIDREKDVAGEIFVNMDLNNNYPIFRQSV